MNETRGDYCEEHGCNFSKCNHGNTHLPFADPEPTECDSDLEERLLSAKHDIELVLLAFYEDQMELVPTGIENAFYKLQHLVDDYCVEEAKP